MPQLRRTPLTWLTYIQLGLWVYFLNGFGPIVALLREEQGLTYKLAGLHSTAMALGMVLGGFLFAPLTRRFTRSAVVWAALAALAISTLGFVALPPWFALTLFCTFIASAGGMTVACGVTVSLSAAHGPAAPAAISEANAVACAAGLMAPLAIGAGMAMGLGWRSALIVLVGLVVIVALFGRRAAGEASTVERSQAPKGPLGSAYWLAWSMLTFTGAIEIVMFMWASTVLNDRVGMSEAGAAAATSAIIGGMLLGRVVGSRLTLRIDPISLYFGTLAVSLTGFVLFWTAAHWTVAIAGLLVMGLGNGMHYPLAVSLALASAPEQPDKAAAVASYSAGISFGVGPFVLGMLADRVGPHAALLLVPLFVVGAGVLAYRLRRLMRAGERLARATRNAVSPEVCDRPIELAQQMP